MMSFTPKRIVELLITGLVALGGLAAPAQASTRANGFEIISDLHEKCLDVDDGHWVQTYGCHGAGNQRWFWRGHSLVSEADLKCLDVKGTDPSNGARVQVYSCNGNANQRWYWDASNRLHSELNGKCLDIKNWDPNDHARVQMYECHSGANQRWYQGG
jgi:streptogrisin C